MILNGGKTIAQIADECEESVDTIRQMMRDMDLSTDD